MKENTIDKIKFFENSNLLAVYSITLIAVLGVASTAPAFPKMTQYFGVTIKEIGSLITLFTVPGVFFAPFLGVAADRLGRKNVLIPSLLLFSIAGTAAAFAESFLLLQILIFIQGIGAAPLGSLNMTIIGDLYPGKERFAVMGYNASVLNIGTAVYPVLGGILAGFAWNYPFMLPVLGIIAAVIVFFQLKSPEPEANVKISDYFKTAISSIKNKEILTFFLLNYAAYVLLFGTLITYLPFLVKMRFGGAPASIGLFLGVMSVSAALVSGSLGKISKKMNVKIMLTTAFALYALALGLTDMIPVLGLLIIPAAIFGLGHGLNLPNINAQLTVLAPKEQRAAFMAVSRMISLLGQASAPIYFALLYDMFGLSGVYYGGAVAAAVFAGFAYLKVK